jgi:hypothetical protein
MSCGPMSSIFSSANLSASPNSGSQEQLKSRPTILVGLPCARRIGTCVGVSKGFNCSFRVMSGAILSANDAPKPPAQAITSKSSQPTNVGLERDSNAG